MDNRSIIQQSIDYIEENLNADITAEELANQAGFSLYHYYRLFQSAVGMPVMQYILRRRLINAIYEIDQSSKVIDVALSYGFDTHAGFYKAFVREYGVSPSLFLKKYKAKKPYKINLFKEEHILITHKKISEILQNWNLENEKIANVFYEVTGNQNDHAYYIGDKYVIKASANLGSFKNHIAISKALANAGFTTAIQIATSNGKEIVQDGELYFILTNRIEGKQINANEMYEGDYKSKARFVGETIGHLDLVLATFGDIEVNDINLFASVKDWALLKVSAIMPLSDDFCEDYLDTFGKLFDKLPKQIIHRDPNPGNIIMGADNSYGFIDFDLSERNLRIFDPCYAATAILSESFNENDTKKLSKWIEIYQNIIYGYDSVVKLSNDEKKGIPYVMFSNQFVAYAWFSEQEKYAELAEINRRMVLWLIENKDKLIIDQSFQEDKY